ncbi:AraC family transcriptional regulator [Pedobacter caeni]|uniref:Transcriptional regulator, AraC family n=1 Tax=Pedobacter caeni TaxID=288992 RepID=A0A1M5B2L9_9SPHI|nr:AraC family transcriptional regulator [Pedobacter caeni]SHF36801.1 transcriptional regulator, AraC family [Pedobacter caeni]
MITLKEFEKEIDLYDETIYMMKEQLEHRFPPHYHLKAQLLLVSGGMAYLKTADQEYYIPSQHYVWIPKGVVHHVKFNTKELTIFNIYFPDESQSPTGFYEELGIYPVSNLLREMISYAENWQGHVFFGSWEYEFLKTMKHLLVNSPGERFSILLPTTEDKRLLDIAGYLQDRLHEPLTLPLVATQFGLSVRNLTRLFQQQLRISFLQYLKMLRMIKAMELLLNGEKNVSEIAYEVGYSSIAAFSNTFQQLIHMRPSDFQKANSGMKESR